MKLLSLSTGSLAHLLDKEYYDLATIMSLMNTIYTQSKIDGFEFQKIAEWDSIGPPRDEYREGREVGFRARAWQSASKYTPREISHALRKTGIPILSLHANRDTGICICAGGVDDINRGKEIIRETLWLCKALQSQIAVFHYWDTWANQIDIALLCRILDQYQSRYPGIRATIENIPTCAEELTPFKLVSHFNSITLDTRWACMYDELERFYELVPRIVNIHLRGRLDGRHWVFDSSNWTFEQTISLIRDKWKYSGLITLEPEGGYQNATLEDLVEALKELRKKLRYPLKHGVH